MRLCRTVIVCAVLTAGAQPGFAVTYKYSSGQTALTLAKAPATRGSCYVGRAPSTYNRADGSKYATITFGELWVQGGYDLSGQALLTFSSSSAGTIAFRQPDGLPPGLAAAAFSGFSQVFNSTTKILTVQFTIAFPDCLQPVIAVYRGT